MDLKAAEDGFMPCVEGGALVRNLGQFGGGDRLKGLREDTAGSHDCGYWLCQELLVNGVNEYW